MKQQTLAAAADQGAGFEQYRRATKRDVFLATMNEIVPWQALCEVIEPHYRKAGNGRTPVGLERMLLRISVPESRITDLENAAWFRALTLPSNLLAARTRVGMFTVSQTLAPGKIAKGES